MLSRRSIFGASAAVVVAAIPASALAHQPYSWFINEARELCLLTDAVNKGGSEIVITEWESRLDVFLERVERLPMVADTAPIRALAIALIHYEDSGEWEQDSACDQRLAGQMVRSLTGGLN